MKIVEQSCRLLDWSEEDLYRRCERAGRISHKSEEKIAPGTAEKFVRKMVKLGHESVFEFARCSLVEFPRCSLKPSEIRTNVRRLRESAKRHGEDSIYRILARSVSRKYPLFFEGETSNQFCYLTVFAFQFLQTPFARIMTNHIISDSQIEYHGENKDYVS